MARRTLKVFAAVAILALGACSEREPGSTTGPQFAPGGTDACGFSNSLITNYFPSASQGKILTLKQSMAAAGHGTSNARTFGFEIMDSVGSVSRSFAVSPAAGAQLTVALIACMFDEASTFTYPEDDAVSAFTRALNSAEGGAYYVRGGGSGGEDGEGRSATVLGTIDPIVGSDVNLSGIKPSSGSWTSMLSENGSSEGRALIYGYSVPNTPALVYDWASVPSGVTFAPAAAVSVCDDDNSGTAMVHEEDIGVLAYIETTICDETQSLTSVERGWGPTALAARVGRLLVSGLIPEPLEAAVLATRGGGTTTTIPKSKFGKQTVDTLMLDWIQGGEPPATIKGTDNPLTANLENSFPVSFTVATESGDPIAGTCAYLSGSNNNGTPTTLNRAPGDRQHPRCTQPPNGDTSALSVLLTTQTIGAKTVSVADFGRVAVTKTGGILLLGIADVLGRDAFGSISIKSNVKPAGK
jgi:hypothetical protein